MKFRADEIVAVPRKWECHHYSEKKRMRGRFADEVAALDALTRTGRKLNSIDRQAHIVYYANR